jgi:hypothetical protein
MKRFLLVRGLSLAVVVLVMFLIAASQAGISYSVEMGPLRKFGLFDSNASQTIVTALYPLRIVFLLLLVMLWALNCKHALWPTIIVANSYFTLALLVDVISLLGSLAPCTRRRRRC